jgi:ketosteroid isomerase-like protein
MPIPRVVAALALSFAVCSFAQEIVTSPSNPSAPAKIENSKAETTATPKPLEKTAAKTVPAPKKERTVAPAQKETSASSTPAAAEPAALSAQAKKGAEATIKELENQWQAAIVSHNQAAVDALLASDFAGINMEGKFVNKSSVIAQVRNDKDTYASSKNDKLNVHIYGANVAVVTGSVRSKGTSKIGQAFDRAYRFTDTWVERDGKWLCVASQDSLLNP